MDKAFKKRSSSNLINCKLAVGNYIDEAIEIPGIDQLPILSINKFSFSDLIANKNMIKEV